MTGTFATQRLRDGAFFEDWSEWASLDDLPEPDKRAGYYLQRPRNHHRFGCCLLWRVNWMGAAAFEVSLPPNDPICKMIKQIPGVRQHPSLAGYNRFASRGLSDTYFVPAEHWRELRAALPAIKAAVTDWVRIPR